ncbi:hypothetical protein Q75_02530 [Bacillus coahuilensis p1.1.43]|uniref:TIGR03943 family protein n=1 Tax=Bacillus coahuilensis p1.1.43 TaxID=1150625 RepID=A0A147KBI0_9BACI|nr:TIGR03943 family protein [Bacillus coahuilensis]KUP08518.1 hypothetical protein Q75_02530 [Bacillus coahuilensis p1.1.43]
METKLKQHTFLRSILLIGYALLVLKLFLTGDLNNFVAPKMHGFLHFALWAFLLIGIIQLIRSTSDQKIVDSCDCEAHELPKSWIGSLWVYGLFILPLVGGFLFPDVLLDSAVAKNRGVVMGSELNEPLSSNPGDSTREAQITSFEEAEALYSEAILSEPGAIDKEIDMEKLKEILVSQDKIVMVESMFSPIIEILFSYQDEFNGKEVQLRGFVYRESEFEENEAVVARFGVTCCTADATVLGLMAEDEQMATIKDDEWVVVSGTFTQGEVKGYSMMVLQGIAVEKIEPIQEAYVDNVYMPVYPTME